MSVEKDSSTRQRVIYVPLLDEGVPVVRPTMAFDLGNGLYKVLATAGYDPENETWKFPPGTVVRCQNEERDGVVILVARIMVHVCDGY